VRRRYRESWGITGGRRLLDRDELWEIFDEGGSAILPRRGQVRETCPVSTGEGTRRVQLVREEGRGVSSQYGREGGGGKGRGEAVFEDNFRFSSFVHRCNDGGGARGGRRGPPVAAPQSVF